LGAGGAARYRIEGKRNIIGRFLRTVFGEMGRALSGAAGLGGFMVRSRPGMGLPGVIFQDARAKSRPRRSRQSIVGRSRPIAAAPGSSSGIGSVPAERISQETRAGLAGLRMACEKRPALLRPRLAVAMPKTMSCQRLPARRDPRFCKMGTAAWLAVQRSGILQEAIAKPDGRETPGGSWGLPRWGPFVRVIGSVYFG
jgi:hypothetical protein